MTPTHVIKGPSPFNKRVRTARYVKTAKVPSPWEAPTRTTGHLSADNQVAYQPRYVEFRMLRTNDGPWALGRGRRAITIQGPIVSDRKGRDASEPIRRADAPQWVLDLLADELRRAD